MRTSDPVYGASRKASPPTYIPTWWIGLPKKTRSPGCRFDRDTRFAFLDLLTRIVGQLDADLAVGEEHQATAVERVRSVGGPDVRLADLLLGVVDSCGGLLAWRLAPKVDAARCGGARLSRSFIVRACSAELCAASLRATRAWISAVRLASRRFRASSCVSTALALVAIAFLWRRASFCAATSVARLLHLAPSSP